jgi:hypothetical protein
MKYCCKACLTFFNLNTSWRALSFFLFVMFLSLNSQHIIHLPNITHPKSIKRNLQPQFISNHHGYQWPQQTSKWWTIGTPPPTARITTDSRSTQFPTPHKSELQQRYHYHPQFGASGCQTLILPALYPSPKSPKSTRHRPTIQGPHMQHDTDDQNYERNLLVCQKMVTYLLQSVPLQTWTVFPTLTKWWPIRRYLFRSRFQWTKTQFYLTFQISWRPYPASSIRRHFSWHTTFCFMNSKLVLHCIFGHNLSTYHPINHTPMASQTIHFVTHKC